MQDVGKLRIPSEIIAKRERLTAAEFDQASAMTAAAIPKGCAVATSE